MPQTMKCPFIVYCYTPKVSGRRCATSCWSELLVKLLQVDNESIHVSECGTAPLLTTTQLAIELEEGTGHIMVCVIRVVGRDLLEAQSTQGHVDFPIGGFSPPEGRLARGFKPPAFSRFLFQSAVKSAESFCTRQLLAGAATRGRKTDCLASCIDQTWCSINSILRGTAAR